MSIIDNHSYTHIEIPFSTTQLAEIVFDVLRVDKEPKRSKTTKQILVVNNLLKAKFISTETKNLRVAVNSFFEHLILACETIETFGPPVSNSYDHYSTYN